MKPTRLSGPIAGVMFECENPNQGWGLDRVKHRPAGSAACSSVVFELQPLREERLLSVRPACAAAQAPKPFGLDQRELFPDKVSGCLDFRRSIPSQPPWLNTQQFLGECCDSLCIA
jgi:hypothetical protein